MLIKSLQKSRKTVYGILVICAAILAMTGFGVNMYGSGRSKNYALRIYDKEVSYEEIAREKRAAEDFYRRMFKDNYEALMANLKIDLNQQVLDRTIEDHLLLHFLKTNGFTYGENALIENIQTNIFGGGRFSKAGFDSVARAQGMSSDELLSVIEGELNKEGLVTLFRSVSTASLAESKAEAIRNDTKYSAWYVEFNPFQFESKVSAPSDEVIENYYNDKASEYQRPTRVAYDYTIINPDKFLNSVELFPEDLQQYYIDNEDKYSLPPRFKALHIKFSIPKGSLPDKVEEIRKKGEEIQAKAASGEDFENLMTEFSDDKVMLAVDKDGYVQKGKLPPEAESAALALKQGGVTELIRTLDAFYVLKVLEVKEKELKPFEEVKSEIEKELRMREAPAFTSAQAQEILDKWNQGTESLSEIAKANSLDEPKSFSLNAASVDPDSTLKGLTSKVIDENGNEKILVELGDRSILVHVTQYKEEEIPPLAEVRDEIISSWKKGESKRLAKEAANTFYEKLKNASGKNLKEFALQEKIPVNEAKDLSPSKGGDPLFSNPEVQKTIFNVGAPLKTPKGPIEAGNKFYIFQTHTISPPKESDIESKVQEAKKGSDQKNGELLLRAFINNLKSKAMAEEELEVKTMAVNM